MYLFRQAIIRDIKQSKKPVCEEDSHKKEDPGEGTKQQMKTRSAKEAVTRRKPNFKQDRKKPATKVKQETNNRY